MLSDLDSKMDARNLSLDGKIVSICAEFNNKIATVSKELNSKLQSTRMELESKINELNHAHSKRSDELESMFVQYKCNSDLKLNSMARRMNQSDLMLYGVPVSKNENVLNIVRDILMY